MDFTRAAIDALLATFPGSTVVDGEPTSRGPTSGCGFGTPTGGGLFTHHYVVFPEPIPTGDVSVALGRATPFAEPATPPGLGSKVSGVLVYGHPTLPRETAERPEHLWDPGWVLAQAFVVGELARYGSKNATLGRTYDERNCCHWTLLRGGVLRQGLFG